MPRILRALGLAVLLLAVPAQAVLPDSGRLQVLSALARGDVAGAIEMYKLATGVSTVPAWLRAFEAAFSASNQAAGACQRVAEAIHTGFSRLGGRPIYLKFSNDVGNVIGWEVRAGDPASTIRIADNNLHLAVRMGDRVYDALTGSAGLLYSDYLARIQFQGQRVIETVASPWVK
jgi:hypothetical protein